jgi:hypothetical protein
MEKRILILSTQIQKGVHNFKVSVKLATVKDFNDLSTVDNFCGEFFNSIIDIK